jgi:hypothetical protein
MTRIAKPKRTRKSSGTLSIESPFSNDDFIKIARTLKMKDFPENARRDLVTIAQEYAIGKELAKNRSTSPEMRYTLQTVVRKAKELAECLGPMDAMSREAIELRLPAGFGAPEVFACPFCELEFSQEIDFKNHLPEHQVLESESRPPGACEVLERCRSDAERIAHAAKDALRSVASKPGPKRPRAPLWRAVASLRTVFQELTGREAKVTYSAMTGRYSGPFLRFVLSFFSFIESPNNLPSRNTIADGMIKNPANSAKHIA